MHPPPPAPAWSRRLSVYEYRGVRRRKSSEAVGVNCAVSGGCDEALRTSQMKLLLLLLLLDHVPSFFSSSSPLQYTS